MKKSKKVSQKSSESVTSIPRDFSAKQYDVANGGETIGETIGEEPVTTTSRPVDGEETMKTNALTANDPHERETNETVTLLNRVAGKDVKAWLVMGRAITLYIEKTKQAEGDAFLRLASHAECMLGAGSLRSHYSAFKLWTEMGRTGIPPEVDYTHFVVVATSAGLNYGNRKNLLQQAGERGWSVAELRRQINLLRRGGKKPEPEPEGEQGGDPKKKPAVDWDMACQSLERNTARLVEDLTFLCALEPKGDVPDELRKTVRKVVRLLITHRLIEREFISDNIQDDISEAAA